MLPVARAIPGEWAALGIAPIAMGLSMAVIGNRQFARAHTAINPFAVPSTLVAGGPFRLSRNPMYLGMVFVLLGAAIAWGTVTPFFVLPPFARLISTRFIAHEETTMKETFGAEYEEYARRVRRWL